MCSNCVPYCCTHRQEYVAPTAPCGLPPAPVYTTRGGGSPCALCAAPCPCIYAPLCGDYMTITFKTGFNLMDQLYHRPHRKGNSQSRARWFDDPKTCVRVAHGQSTCRPTAGMALHEHLQGAERKGLGEEYARIGHRGAQYIIFRHD